MAKKHLLAGPGKALLFLGDDLIGVATVLQESGLSLSTDATEIRGGQSNMLYGQYFHNSNMAGNLTDAMFNLHNIAANLGTNVESGGLSVKEEGLIVPMGNGKVTLTEQAVAFDGSMIGWYRKIDESDWQVATISKKDMTIPGAKAGEKYCVKYFYHNENAKSILIKAQYVPRTLHLVLIHDLFAGEVEDIGKTTAKYGRIITDIPRFQLSGSQDLSLTAEGAATTSLAGKALAVETGDACEEDPYYGTMTQEIYGAKWQDDVVALAVENGDVEIGSGETETLIVRAVFGAGMGAQRKDNSNFTFAIEENPASTASDTRVDPETGVITGGSTRGSCVISATLKGAPAGVEPAYILVTATGA